MQNVLIKEDAMQIHLKMDAVNLQGIWLNFPGVARSGNASFAAGIYLQLLREEQEKSKKKKRRKETHKQMRDRLLREVEKRIVQRDDDDLMLILGI